MQYSNIRSQMAASGHKRPIWSVHAVSALPPIATGSPQCIDRRYWPIGYIDCIYSIASWAVASNVCGMIAALPMSSLRNERN